VSVSKRSNITRGHNLKLGLVCHRHHYDLRKYSFVARIVNTWNSLLESVIAAETTNCFKNMLDKFIYLFKWFTVAHIDKAQLIAVFM